MSATISKTSPEGVAFLERHEGVVLKAYRDPVGIWTIGAGLTKASGVITPKGGMRITKAQATELLTKALRRNYEPAVAAQMQGANQHEFDAGVSFHFNTGAIKRAHWVLHWVERDWASVERSLAQWRKAGGRVLKGLVRRRAEEFQVMRFGNYGSHTVFVSGTDMAKIVVPMSVSEITNLRADLKSLGFDPGEVKTGVKADVVKAFQAAHGLTVDAKIGRATLSTVQRMRNATRDGVKAGGTAAAAGGAGFALPDVDALPLDTSTFGVAGGVLWFAWYVWSYRDAFAGLFEQYHPDFAKWLREV